MFELVEVTAFHIQRLKFWWLFICECYDFLICRWYSVEHFSPHYTIPSFRSDTMNKQNISFYLTLLNFLLPITGYVCGGLCVTIIFYIVDLTV